MMSRREEPDHTLSECCDPTLCPQHDDVAYVYNTAPALFARICRNCTQCNVTNWCEVERRCSKSASWLRRGYAPKL